MNSLSIVKALYPVNDIQPSALAIMIPDLVKPFYFQGFKKTLHGCIVPRIGLSAHGHYKAILRNQLLMHVTGILATPIGM